MKDRDESGYMPTVFDRQMATLNELPDVVKTKPTNKRHVPPLGVGGSQLFIVQTFRQRERGDSIFLEVIDDAGATRIVIPSEVADVIARQRDALTTKTRSRAAQATADDLKVRGLKPGFMLTEAERAERREKKGGGE